MTSYIGLIRKEAAAFKGRRYMRVLALMAGLIFAAPLASAAQSSAGGAGSPVLHGPAANASAILSAERSFEAQSVKAGMAAAFLDHMDATDGLEFAGGAPVRGAAAISQVLGKNSAGQTLRWVPCEVFASTGDLGAVWGTWALVPKPGAKPITGRYVTVWRRDHDGVWKGLIDIGTPDP